LFDEYLSKHIVAGGRYFSFVRPLYELQIGELFSRVPALFDLFKSCNRKRSDSWCGECPKCLSVFLTMYPFVSRSSLVKIFGTDLFHREGNTSILRQLAGLDVKPFECVATTGEIATALALSIEKAKAGGDSLPPVLAYAAENIPAIKSAVAAPILNSYGSHRIPQEFESFLTNALKRSPRSL
jgi:hypothetical protein